MAWGPCRGVLAWCAVGQSPPDHRRNTRTTDKRRVAGLGGSQQFCRGRPGRPRWRFDALLADKGYDSDAFRRACRDRGTEPIIPHCKTIGVEGLGKLRYVVEQSL